jgi:hypothetical protein
MPIVVDGDSVAVVTSSGVPESQKWSALLAASRGKVVRSLAQNKSTARDCLLRMWRVFALRPSWYVLLIGQWSQNHEPLNEFKAYTRQIIESMHLRQINVCLMTPPTAVGELEPYLAVLRRCAAIYRCGLMDLHRHMAGAATPEWFDNNSSVPCHFSAYGAQKVVEFFDLPENAHLCR